MVCATIRKPKHDVGPTLGLATRFHRGRPSCERREIGLTKSDFALFWSEAKVRVLPCLGSPPNELEPILARAESDRREARTLRQVCSIDAQDRVCPCAGFGQAFVRATPRRGWPLPLEASKAAGFACSVRHSKRSAIARTAAHRRVRRFVLSCERARLRFGRAGAAGLSAASGVKDLRLHCDAAGSRGADGAQR